MMPKRNKGTIKDWLKVAILLLDEVAIVALVFIVLWVLKIEIPLPVTIVGALLFGVLVFIIHKAIIPTFRKKQVTGVEGMIGGEGEVVEPLRPMGIVRVNGEYWKAKSTGGDIAAGENVEILGLDRLTLEVRHKGHN